MPEIERGFAIRELWEKYEEIAMHFNDLIIRLRTQALAGVAALSTLVGLFAKSDLGPFSYSWEIAILFFWRWLYFGSRYGSSTSDITISFLSARSQHF